jgi:hypothetical protein
MVHCRQCRADAVGTLDDDQSLNFGSPCRAVGAKLSKKAKKFAVASRRGMLVDQHFGHAGQFYIYETDGTKVKFVEKRLVSSCCYRQG